MRIKRKTITWLLKRLLLLFAFFLFVALCIWGYFAYDSAADLRSAVAETDRVDPGWRWEELEAKRPIIPDAENGALVVLAAAKLLPANWDQVWRKTDGTDTDLENSMPLTRMHPRYRLDGETEHRLSGAQQQIEAAWRELQKLHSRHQSIYPLDTERFLQTGEILSATPSMDLFKVCRVVSWYELHRERPEAAWEACHVGLRIGHSLEKEPTSVAFLTRANIRTIVASHLERILAQREPSEALLATMQQHVQGELQPLPAKEMLRWERAHVELRMTRAAEEGQTNFGPGRPSVQEWWAYTGIGTTYSRAESLRQFNELITIVEKPHKVKQSDLGDWDDRCKKRSAENYLYRRGLLMMPAMYKVITAADKSEATLRCTVAALAAERFRRQHGRWPSRWEELVPNFLPAVPQDVFRDAPLMLKPTPDGLVIYSVGVDGVDNDGELDRDRKISSVRGKDIGFQLWNPDVRKQPLPFPEKKDDE